MRSPGEIAASWDAEYQRERYRCDPPLAFVEDIVDAARRSGRLDGIYLGCGNGRNYVPLRRAGLRLIGLDVSRVAIEQLGERAPEYRADLRVGNLSSLPAEGAHDLVVALQVLRHGRRDVARAHVRAAQGTVSPGGLIAVRVNATGTDIEYRHDVVERGSDGSHSVHYLEGPKAGLDIHFFAEEELEGLFAESFEPILPLRRADTRRTPPASGVWCQWEGIWQRNG